MIGNILYYFSTLDGVDPQPSYVMYMTPKCSYPVLLIIANVH